MRRTLLFLSAILFSMQLFATPIKQIVFFGDSLTDNGNLYHMLLKFIPKPPYYEGRFSNGITWAEGVGNYYKNKYGIDYKIYAVGGATAEFHAPTTSFVTISTLAEQYYQYKLSAWFESKSDVLYSIWIGGNDYLFDTSDDLNILTTQVVDHVAWLLKNLIDQGARYFIVINMPDLSLTPFAKQNNIVERLKQASIMHNQKLAELVKTLQTTYPEVSIVYIDSYGFMDDVVENPEKYNQKYHINIKNTANACWEGGFRLKQMHLQQALKNELDAKLQNKNEWLGNVLLQNPALNEAYAVNQIYQQNKTACQNADEFLFWDRMHPTAIAHNVLSQIVLEKLAPTIG